jgi:hypothetical protein
VPLRQIAPVVVQVLFAQQGWPGSPHARQVPPWQRLPDAQVLFGQQVWPGRPQGWQIVPAQ